MGTERDLQEQKNCLIYPDYRREKGGTIWSKVGIHSYLGFLEINCLKGLVREPDRQLDKLPDDLKWKDSRVFDQFSEYLGLSRTVSPIHPQRS